MTAGVFNLPDPTNEPVRATRPARPSAPRSRRASRMAGERIEIPLVIGGREVRTGHDDGR